MLGPGTMSSKRRSKSATHRIGFVGARGVDGYHELEIRFALDRSVKDQRFRFVVVLLPGAAEPEQLPPFLRLRNVVDLRQDLDDERAWDRLLAGVLGRAHRRVYRFAPGWRVRVCGERGLEVDQEARREACPRHASTALAIAFLSGLANSRVPTRVMLDLVVDRLAFTIGPGEERIGTENIELQALTIERFERARLSTVNLEVADPRRYDFETDGYPTAAWRPMPASASRDLQSGEPSLQPAITFESRDTGGKLGSLDNIYAQPGIADHDRRARCAGGALGIASTRGGISSHSAFSSAIQLPRNMSHKSASARAVQWTVDPIPRLRAGRRSDRDPGASQSLGLHLTLDRQGCRGVLHDDPRLDIDLLGS